MPKPDFFLPFHLPPILNDTDVLNIAYEGFVLDRDFNYVREISVPKEFIQQMRIDMGVYQTIKCAFLKGDVRKFCQPIVTFSISLN